MASIDRVVGGHERRAPTSCDDKLEFGHLLHGGWRVVTDALSSKPKLVVLRFDKSKQRWIDDRAGQIVSPGISRVEATIVSLR